MAGGKETPRQKMIGMMYLVLTALLALNVSKEIINAFVKLDQKLMESNLLYLNQGDLIMEDFEQSMMIPSNKKQLLPYYEKAEKVRQLAFETDKFINMDCRNELIKAVESTDWVTVDEKNKRFIIRNPMEIETKDDYDAATRLFGGEQGTEGYERGAGIRTRIHKYRDELLELITDYDFAGKKYKFNPKNIDDTDESSIERTMKDELAKNVYEEDRERVKAIYKILTLPENIQDNEEMVAWQLGTFDHAPVVAASALFTALSNDIRSAEVKALELVRSRVKTIPFKVNKIDITAMARTNYINMGDSLDLRVLMAAYDSTDLSIIKYAIDADTANENNWKEVTGKIKLDGNKTGLHKVKGVLGVRERGVLQWKPWKFAYEVGEPMAAIENTEMNLLYAEYQNKLKVSASGFAQDKITLSAPTGISVTRTGDTYVLKPSSNLNGRVINLTVTAKTADGKSKSLGSFQYKVRRMPTPDLYVGNVSSKTGKISKGDLLSGFLTASYGTEFPLVFGFKVKSFDMVVNYRGTETPFSSNSNEIVRTQKDVIRNMRSGQYVTFSKIRVMDQNGKYVSIPSFSLQIE